MLYNDDQNDKVYNEFNKPKKSFQFPKIEFSKPLDFFRKIKYKANLYKFNQNRDKANNYTNIVRTNNNFNTGFSSTDNFAFSTADTKPRFNLMDKFSNGNGINTKTIGAILIVAAIFIIIYSIVMPTRLPKRNNMAEEEPSIVPETTNETANTTVREEPVVAVETTEMVSNHLSLSAHEIIRTSKVPKQNLNIKDDIKNLYYKEERLCYLTFDDGPSESITPQILDTLKANSIPATFFVVGRRVEQHPELVKRAYEEGHYIANHSYTHEYSSVYATPETPWEEYLKTEEAIKNALGNSEYNSYLFRFPGGSSGGKYNNIKAQAKEIFEANAVGTVNWSSLTNDAAGANTSEDQIASLITSSADDTTTIVLMHDANDKQVTADTLQQVIDYFREQGYEFRNFYDLYQ